MTAAEQAKGRLAPATDLDLMVERHIRFEDFTGHGQVETRLSERLLTGDRARALLVGQAGSGKSSLASAAADLAYQVRGDGDLIPHLIPVPAASIRAATNEVSAVRAVLEEASKHFSGANRLAQGALASERTFTPGKRGLAGSLGVKGMASLSGSTEAAVTALKTTTSLADVRAALDDVVGELVDKGVLAVLFFDDADKILKKASGVDEGALDQLFNVLTGLHDLEAAMLVSLQPEYLDYGPVLSYNGLVNATVTVPKPDSPRDFLQAVVDRALTPVNLTFGEVFAPEAFGALVGIYADTGHDMRRVLKAADGAVYIAAEQGAEQAAVDHVVQAVEELGPATR